MAYLILHLRLLAITHCSADTIEGNTTIGVETANRIW